MQRFLTALLLLASCKPAPVARVLETGGESVSWRVTPSLSSNSTTTPGTNQRGELRVENGAGATESVGRISRVELQVQTAPEGTITKERLVAKQWIALSQGTDELTFNLVMTTENARTCYANGSRLSGASEAVFCKGGQPVQPATATEIARELKASCLRLAGIKPDPDKSEFFTRSETLNADLSCVCLNGKERTLRFDEFNNKPLKDAAAAFEVSCTRREAKTGETLTVIDKNYNACAEVVAGARTKLGRTDVQLGAKSCLCGTEKLTYDDTRFASDPQALDKECRRVAGITTTLPGATDLPAKPNGQEPQATAAQVEDMRKYCKERLHHDLSTHCDCREDGIPVDRTDNYTTYKSLDEFKKRADNLLCD